MTFALFYLATNHTFKQTFIFFIFLFWTLQSLVQFELSYAFSSFDIPHMHRRFLLFLLAFSFIYLLLAALATPASTKLKKKCLRNNTKKVDKNTQNCIWVCVCVAANYVTTCSNRLIKKILHAQLDQNWFGCSADVYRDSVPRMSICIVSIFLPHFCLSRLRFTIFYLIVCVCTVVVRYVCCYLLPLFDCSLLIFNAAMFALQICANK